MVYQSETAVRREIEAWADEIRETDSYLLAYQEPIGAENAVTDDEEARFDAEHREMLTVWEKLEQDDRFRNRQSMGGQAPSYREKFEAVESDADAEALF